MSFEFISARELLAQEIDAARINSSYPVDVISDVQVYSTASPLLLSPSLCFNHNDKTFIMTVTQPVNFSLFTLANLNAITNWRAGATKKFTIVSQQGSNFDPVAPTDPAVTYYTVSANNYITGSFYVRKNGNDTYTMWFIGSTL
jgi:hypothetical protein